MKFYNVRDTLSGDTTMGQIGEAVRRYAEFHGVEADAVDVTRVYDGDGDRVVRFRLSLDTDVRSHGCDEWHDVDPSGVDA
jgi:hypothetical protein